MMINKLELSIAFDRTLLPSGLSFNDVIVSEMMMMMLIIMMTLTQDTDLCGPALCMREQACGAPTL